ncbi:Ni/Fe-hydrogenase, b-type cytochrome subunit [Helicobacter fennelliae]|uniref:Quinone-reactive Ni/Fe hydrogenase, cytochrome b subunit n=2 Tax=Helicobacter fennelliae TaxID=215 RepID=T1DX98_9HELI|nr:Ni/Fe-hydrogenase, b-type cytochrome subunit [Helicobacter fennelliae]GAD20077.1 quinone-reactive Ni/Fe hydrogenase, cytochrome b subunit [Helicobacter fennelliae MRY12-0050]SQB98250.1 Ni/Fe hydrogenase cytochrome b subunit [Helicobacter fennelliae]
MREAIDSGKQEFKATTEFSGLTRIFHWLRALAIFGLIATGFYIAVPFLQGAPSAEPTLFTQAYIRSVHIILGFVLIAISFFRVYLYFFDKKGSAEERKSFKQFLQPKVWIDTIKCYIWIGRHPHIDGTYNPLQFITYLTLGVLVLLISLTGVALYANVYHEGLGGVLGVCFKWVEVVCGGLSNVRMIHHILTWIFIIFIPVHIYLVVWNSLKYPNGGADAIISGIRYQKDLKV